MAVACAPKAPPVAPGAPKHPDFVFPAAPEGTSAAQVARLERGWQYLQLDDLRNAEREFSGAIKQQPALVSAETALAYLSLARGNEKDAESRFDRALQTDATYVPALVGRGQALLQQERDADALVSFEAALAKDPSLADIKSRVDVLRVRAAQQTLNRARAAADARRWDEAATLYRQAIAASPDSSFLYRDLAGVERNAGQLEGALEHYRKAAELDPGDAKALAGIGAILDGQGDVLGALAAYERARAVDTNEVPDSVMTRLRAASVLAKMPAQFRAIPERAVVTRADIAALIGVRLEALIAKAKPRQVIITDVRGHWAQQWITPVVRAGLMDTLPNYEFDPGRQVRRNELATTVSHVLALIAAIKPDAAKKWQEAKPVIADVGAAHLSYPAVSVAAASGVMPLNATGNFDLLRTVSGSDALEIIGRLEALAR